jgi:hypothetical protein
VDQNGHLALTGETSRRKVSEVGLNQGKDFLASACTAIQQVSEVRDSERSVKIVTESDSPDWCRESEMIE